MNSDVINTLNKTRQDEFPVRDIRRYFVLISVSLCIFRAVTVQTVYRHFYDLIRFNITVYPVIYVRIYGQKCPDILSDTSG